MPISRIAESVSLGWYEGDGYDMKTKTLLTGEEIREVIAAAIRGEESPVNAPDKD